MFITKLEKAKSKMKIRVYIDNEYYTELDESIVNKYGLTENISIEDQKFKDVMLESELKDAKEKLFNYLTKCMKTTKECVKYLKDRGYNNLVIYKTINIAEEYKIVDDRKYAQYFIDFNKEKRSINYIKNSLSEKGIDKKILDDLIENCEIDEESNAYKEGVKYLKNKELNKKETERLIRHLYSKGFSWSNIKDVLNKLKAEQWLEQIDG